MIELKRRIELNRCEMEFVAVKVLIEVMGCYLSSLQRKLFSYFFNVLDCFEIYI